MTKDIYVQAKADHIASLARATPLSAVEELVWNALDADAREVRVDLVQNALGGIDARREHRAALAVRHRDRDAAPRHALEEDRRRVEHLERAVARLELLGRVALELRPRLGAGDDVLELREHLAAVAHAEREGVLKRIDRAQPLPAPSTSP